MLRHGRARSGRYDRSRCADVECVRRVSSRAAGINQTCVPRTNRRHVLSQRGGRTRKLLDALPLRTECHEKTDDFLVRTSPLHDLVDDAIHLLKREITPAGDGFQR